MKCEGAKELFSEFFEGTIDHALTTALRDHIGACESCKSDFELFQQTWGMMESLPEIAPPVNFRHDVVMRVARMQHDEVKVTKRKGLFANVGSLIGSIAHARPIAIAGVAVAIALLLFRVPEKAYQAWIGPGAIIEQGQTGQSQDVSQESLDVLTAGSKSEWQERKMGRNTVWVSIEPKRTHDGRMLHRVLFSINQNALLPGEVCTRIASEVYLLPPDQFALDGTQPVNLVWKGSIFRDAPVIVPVVYDSSQGQYGSLNLLLVWKFRDRTFEQIIFIPSEYRGLNNSVRYFSMDSPNYTSNNGDLYSTLQSIAESYGVPVIANAAINDKSPMVVSGQGTLEWALQSTMSPIGLDWMAADHVLYIDKEYKAKEIP